MSIKPVVFDMAGTTVSDENYVAISFQQAMKQHGYMIALEDVNPMMGYEKPLAIKMMPDKYEANVKKTDEDIIHQVHTGFVDMMIHFYKHSTAIKPLPNAENTFSELRNMDIKIGLDIYQKL